MSEPRPLSVVCAYADGLLETPWFRAYKKLKRTSARASLGVRVDLRPQSDVHAGADVVAVPPGVAVEAPGAELLVAKAEELQPAFDALVQRLLAEGRLAHAAPPSRAVVRHRGFEPLDGRGRVAD